MPILTVILNDNIMKVSFIVLIIAAMVNPSAANTQASTIRSNQFGTRLSVSHNWYYEITSGFCGGEFPYFVYRQRMTIGDGKSEFVATDVFLKPKEYSLELLYFCEGFFYYYVFSLPEEPGLGLENSAMFVRADNKTMKICKLVESH